MRRRIDASLKTATKFARLHRNDECISQINTSSQRTMTSKSLIQALTSVAPCCVPGQESIAPLRPELSIASNALIVTRLHEIIMLKLQTHSNHQRQRKAKEAMEVQVSRLLLMQTSMNSRRRCPLSSLSLLAFVLDGEGVGAG